MTEKTFTCKLILHFKIEKKESFLKKETPLNFQRAFLKKVQNEEFTKFAFLIKSAYIKWVSTPNMKMIIRVKFKQAFKISVFNLLFCYCFCHFLLHINFLSFLFYFSKISLACQYRLNVIQYFIEVLQINMFIVSFILFPYRFHALLIFPTNHYL